MPTTPGHGKCHPAAAKWKAGNLFIAWGGAVCQYQRRAVADYISKFDLSALVLTMRVTHFLPTLRDPGRRLRRWLQPTIEKTNFQVRCWLSRHRKNCGHAAEMSYA